MDGWALSVDNPGEGGRGVDGRPAHRTRLSFSLTEGGGMLGCSPPSTQGGCVAPHPSIRAPRAPAGRVGPRGGHDARAGVLVPAAGPPASGGAPGRTPPVAPHPMRRCPSNGCLSVVGPMMYWVSSGFFLLSFSRRTASPVLVHQKIKQWGPSLRPLTPEHSNLVDLDSVGSLPFAPPRSPSPWASLRAQTLVRLRAPQGLFAVGWISCQSFGWPSTKPCNGIWDPRDEIFLRPRLYPSA